ncbi:MAG: twin-arginine translocation signal domain-containing protein [bacterium]|nr:twin-arginine translocation signal domain-containing protein [bacterium]
MEKQVEKLMKRRGFLKASTLGVLGAGVAGSPGMIFSSEKKAADVVQEVPQIKSFRTLGRTGFKVSDIAIGAAYIEGVISASLDAGINYIDTAESYHQGRSEIAIGKAIKNRNRKSLFITTKLGLKGKETKADILKRSRKCLERLQTDYIDCMMIHSAKSTSIIKYPPFHEAMTQLKKEGRIKHIGAACHGSQWSDGAESMEKILLAAVADGRFDVILLVYNFLKRDMGENILKACKEKNIGATLMKTNPVGGYFNAKVQIETLKDKNPGLSSFFKEQLPRLKAKADKAQEFLKELNLKTPAQFKDTAIKFVLSNPSVHSVCCTIVNFDEMETFLKLSGSKLSQQESRFLSAFEDNCGQLYCRHACGFCESQCPHNVPVNTIMRYNHYFTAQNREKLAMEKYKHLSTANAANCANCTGKCQSSCPYGVPIQPLLALAHDTLTLA